LHSTSEHGVSSITTITTADAHTSAASSRLNWHPRHFKWTHPFRWKTKSGFCACAITFRTCFSNNWQWRSETTPTGLEMGRCWVSLLLSVISFLVHKQASFVVHKLARLEFLRNLLLKILIIVLGTLQLWQLYVITHYPRHTRSTKYSRADPQHHSSSLSSFAATDEVEPRMLLNYYFLINTAEISQWNTPTKQQYKQRT